MIDNSRLYQGLRELADAQLQERLWVKGDASAMSSFSEAIAYTFDDSHVGQAIDSSYLQNNFPNSFVNKILSLRKLVRAIPESSTPQDIVAHPKMQEVRAIAQELLNSLGHARL